MEGHIGRLHSRYQVFADSASAAVAHLDRIGREDLAPACESALDTMVGNDPAVWIVRSISVQFVLNLDVVWQDNIIARQWGKRIALAAMREVVKGPDDQNVMRFDDQVDLVARFLFDLLHGQAWKKWFYGCFERFRDRPQPEVVLAVLLDERELMAPVLAKLEQLGSLDLLIGMLGGEALEELWTVERNGVSIATEDEIRPLFAAALRLVPASHAASTTRATAARWLHEYLQTKPVAPDWRDRSGLTAAVIAVLEFLWGAGYLQSTPGEIAQGWNREEEDATGEFEWLDMRLVNAAMSRMTAESKQQVEVGRPALERLSITPRRRRLLADLAKVIASELPAMVENLPNPHAASLKIYARLCAARPEWQGDPLALRAIDGLLATAAWISANDGAWIAAALDSIENEVPEASDVLQQARIAMQGGPAGVLNASSYWDKKPRDPGNRATVDLARLLMLDALRQGRARNPGLDNVSSLFLARAIASHEAETDRGPAKGSVSARAIHALGNDRASRPGSLPTVQFLRAFGDAGLDLAAAVAVTRAAADEEHEANVVAGIETSCAGVFLLIRAMVDARLAAVASSAGYPLAPCILMLGVCWGGEKATHRGKLDTGIGLLAGQGSDFTLGELRDIWRHVDETNHASFQTGILRMLISRGVIQSNRVAIHRRRLEGGQSAIIFGSSNVWPLVRVVASQVEEESAIAEMKEIWAQSSGEDLELVEAEPESIRALEDALQELLHNKLGLPFVDLTLALTGISLLRVWAIWLRQFSESSVPYLLRNFIHRPGTIARRGNGLIVGLSHRPLDIVIEMAGYVSPFHARTEPWECGITFHIENA